MRTEGAIEILMVDDNPGDVRLTQEALKSLQTRHHLNTVGDGIEAIAYLRRKGLFQRARRPNLILLDLNLPRKDGREVLAEIKADKDLRRIPVIVLTTSSAEEDILHAYDSHANCYISKPLELSGLTRVLKAIEEFWFVIVRLPPK